MKCPQHMMRLNLNSLAHLDEAELGQRHSGIVGGAPGDTGSTASSSPVGRGPRNPESKFTELRARAASWLLRQQQPSDWTGCSEGTGLPGR